MDSNFLSWVKDTTVLIFSIASVAICNIEQTLIRSGAFTSEIINASEIINNNTSEINDKYTCIYYIYNIYINKSQGSVQRTPKFPLMSFQFLKFVDMGIMCYSRQALWETWGIFKAPLVALLCMVGKPSYALGWETDQLRAWTVVWTWNQILFPVLPPGSYLTGFSQTPVWLCFLYRVES